MGYEMGTNPSGGTGLAQRICLESNEFTAWMYYHDGDKMLKNCQGLTNVYRFLLWHISPEAAGCSKRNQSVDDLNGLKDCRAGQVLAVKDHV